MSLGPKSHSDIHPYWKKTLLNFGFKLTLKNMAFRQQTLKCLPNAKRHITDNIVNKSNSFLIDCICIIITSAEDHFKISGLCN